MLEELGGVPFRLRGYPEDTKEKLLLIVISRLIERRAWLAGEGRIRTSFQRLSRINDERGTRAVYDRQFRRSWFVVYTPPPDATRDPAALLACESEPKTWEGVWTYAEERVSEITEHIRRTM